MTVIGVDRYRASWQTRRACDARSRRSTCSRPSPASATRSRSCSTATGSRPTAMQRFAHAGRTCPRRRSSSRPTTRRRLPRPDLHARRRSSRSRATRRSGRATRGSRRAACRATRTAIVQECGSGLVEVRRDGDVLAFARAAAAALGPGGRGGPRRRSPAPLGHRARRRSSTRRGATTGPAGRRSCSRAPTRVLEVRIGAVAPPRPRDRRARTRPARRSRSRCAPSWPQHGSIVEDPVTGQPQRVGGALADRHGTASGRRTSRRRAAAIGRAARILDHAGPRRHDPRRRPDRDARRGDGRPLGDSPART